jgi:hypothetical protein
MEVQVTNVHAATQFIRRNFQQLNDKEVAKATVRAINRSLMKGRTVARTEVKKVYNIPQKNLGGVNNINAKTSNLAGYITASTIPIPMDAFSPKFTSADTTIRISRKGAQVVNRLKKAKKSPAKGVSIEVIKGNREVVPYAFMIAGTKARVFARGAYKSGGAYGFVQRHKRLENSSGNDSVKPLLSVTVHAAVINPHVNHRLQSEVIPFYGNRLQHELEEQVRKMDSNNNV